MIINTIITSTSAIYVTCATALHMQARLCRVKHAFNVGDTGGKVKRKAFPCIILVLEFIVCQLMLVGVFFPTKGVL